MSEEFGKYFIILCLAFRNGLGTLALLRLPSQTPSVILICMLGSYKRGWRLPPWFEQAFSCGGPWTKSCPQIPFLFVTSASKYIETHGAVLSFLNCWTCMVQQNKWLRIFGLREPCNHLCECRNHQRCVYVFSRKKHIICHITQHVVLQANDTISALVYQRSGFRAPQKCLILPSINCS